MTLRTKPRTVQYWLTLISLLRKTWNEYQHDYARYFAGAMVYYALVSLIPLLLLLLSALGLLLRFSNFAANAQQQVLRAVEIRFGAELLTVIEPLLDAVLQQSVMATIISLVALLLTASVLFRQLRMSFRALWKYAPPLVSGSVWVVVRTSVREQVMAYVMVLFGGILLIAALAVLSIGWWFNTMLSNVPLLSIIGGWLLTSASQFGLAAITFALLLRYLPPVVLPWKYVWLAALLCAAAYWIAGELLTLYGIFFSSNRSAYGVIGALLVIMLWMNSVGQVLFFGAELCKVVATEADNEYNRVEQPA